MILNYLLQKKIGNNAYNYAKSLSWDKIAEKTYKIYKKLYQGFV